MDPTIPLPLLRVYVASICITYVCLYTTSCCRMFCLCNRAYGSCRRACEPVWSTLRVLENLPLIGHMVAALYACCGLKSQAERSALKATLGIIMVVINFPAEMMDEISRRRSRKIFSYRLTPRNEWMSRFRSRSLNNLCLPGTHQSATYHIDRKLSPIPLVEGWSQCQGLDIETQLVGGVRLLDLRITSDTKTNEIWLHHNVVYCVKFKEVMETVRDFVVEHPSEIIILHLANDGKPIDWGNVHTVINEFVGTRLIPQHMRNRSIGQYMLCNTYPKTSMEFHTTSYLKSLLLLLGFS